LDIIGVNSFQRDAQEDTGARPEKPAAVHREWSESQTAIAAALCRTRSK
jgi:hypothetical protein